MAIRFGRGSKAGFSRSASRAKGGSSAISESRQRPEKPAGKAVRMKEKPRRKFGR